ncbi:uncharacterized protein V1510DRAFT_401501 [Dipodascopsis tothii]|uniref:uncharacterized protein n=1 Tax=Dipodascopsis tothii TaxID=44089 RepID=UPI0034CE5B35
MKFTGLLVAALSALIVSVRADPEDFVDAEETYVPQLSVSSVFLDSPLQPVTLLNTKPNRVELTLTNNEDKDCSVQVAGGALFALGGDVAIDNMTAARVGPLTVPGHSSQVVPYSFVVDREPKDYVLRLGLLVEFDGQLLQTIAYNSTVSIADVPVSFFDPQLLFLYVVLTAVFGGSGYFAYQKFGKPYLKARAKAQKQKEGVKPRVARKSPTPVASTTGSDAKYDESWIPEHHLRSSTPKPKNVKKVKKTTK